LNGEHIGTTKLLEASGYSCFIASVRDVDSFLALFEYDILSSRMFLGFAICLSTGLLDDFGADGCGVTVKFHPYSLAFPRYFASVTAWCADLKRTSDTFSTATAERVPYCMTDSDGITIMMEIYKSRESGISAFFQDFILNLLVLH